MRCSVIFTPVVWHRAYGRDCTNWTAFPFCHLRCLLCELIFVDRLLIWENRFQEFTFLSGSSSTVKWPNNFYKSLCWCTEWISRPRSGLSLIPTTLLLEEPAFMVNNTKYDGVACGHLQGEGQDNVINVQKEIKFHPTFSCFMMSHFWVCFLLLFPTSPPQWWNCNKETLRQGCKQKFACVFVKAAGSMNKPVQEQSFWGGL